MDIKRIVERMSVALLGAAALSLAGCSVQATEEEGIEEDIGDEAAEIGTECAAAAVTATFVGGINFTSPQTYSTTNCFKAVVLDVTNFKNGFAPEPIDGFTHTFRSFVQWADALPSLSDPNREALYSQLWLDADLFEVVNGIPVYKTTKESFGFCGFFCSAPLAIDFAPLMQPGKTYRISATARTSKSSAAPTRKVNVTTNWFANPK